MGGNSNAQGVFHTSETARMKFVSPDQVEELVLDWGTMKFLSSPTVTGAARFSVGIAEILPRRSHPIHNHEGIEEIIYVVSGSGQQSVGEEVRHVKPGDLVHVASDANHSTVNTCDEPLVLLVVYSPTGPEETLREMAKARKNEIGE